MTEDELYDEVFTKGYDMGKRDAEQVRWAELDRLRSVEYKSNSYIVDNARLAEESERLRNRVMHLELYLKGEAYCPCCTGLRECEEGCTFAEDDPSANERMLEVRAVLYGG